MEEEDQKLLDTSASNLDNTAECGIQSERARVAELIAIGEAYSKCGGKRMAADAIRNGHSKKQLQQKLLEAMRTNPLSLTTRSA